MLTVSHIKELLQDTPADITVRAVPIEDMIENLTIIRDHCLRKGIALVLCAEAVNTTSDKMPQYLSTHSAMSEFAAANQIPFLDVHKLITSLPDSSRLFLDEVHLTPEGHRIVAGLLFDLLVQTGILEN